MPFEKGRSGNPGGRPKEAAEVKSLAQEYGPKAIKRLADLMDDDDKRVSVAACQALLDRGYGKPTQQTELTGADGKDLIPESITLKFIKP